MKEKTLIFIPYQDTDNFYSDGIMTREYAMLYLLFQIGYKNVINVKKPRTYLDKKKHVVHDEYYPNGTKELEIKNILDHSETVQYLPIFNLNQVIKRRGWWNDGYKKTIDIIKLEDNKEYLIYSDNPYAVDLIENLVKRGCKLFFDVMDNFAIHPSLNKKEHQIALQGYKKVFEYSDYISANSQQTCAYMQKYTNKKVILVKNGVFADNEAKDSLSIEAVKTIRIAKEKYKNCVGYIGKLGLRLDAKLIDEISSKCPNTLFVFVGGYLKGQINDKLIEMFEKRNNVLHIGSVPSAYVYPILNEFDILSIPHAVGKAENGGDPLKLYQYLTRNKPILATPILGVDEFKDSINISIESSDWIRIINSVNATNENIRVHGITWDERMSSILNRITTN